MKLFLLAFLLALPAFAGPCTYRVDTSSANLAATFTTNAQLSCAVAVGMDELQVVNNTAGEIEVNCMRSSQPSSNQSDSIYVGAGLTWSSPIRAGLGKKCWIRSVSGTLSSGIILITGWGN